MRYQAVLASPDGHTGSDMFATWGEAEVWAINHMHDGVRAFIYKLEGYCIAEVYVLVGTKWRYISC